MMDCTLTALLIYLVYLAILLTSIVAIYAIIICFRYQTSAIKHMPSAPIGDIFFAELGQAISRNSRIFGSSTGHMVRLAELGPIRRMHICRGKSRVEISDPELVKQVLVNSAKFPRGNNFALEQLEVLVGPQSILLAHGEQHNQMRRRCSPIFSNKSIQLNFLEIIQKKSKHIVNIWKECTSESPAHGADIVVDEHLGITMLEIVLFIITGRDFQESTCQEDSDLVRIIRKFAEVQNPKYFRHQTLPFMKEIYMIFHRIFRNTMIPEWLKRLFLERHRAGFDYMRLIDAVIDNHKLRQYSENRGLSSVANNRCLLDDLHFGTKNNEISNEDVCSLIGSLLFAGHETVANGIMWTLKLLADNPIQQQQCQSEIDEYISGNEDNNCLSWESMQSKSSDLPYLTTVIKESLRLYTPVPFTLRSSGVESGTELGGYTIPYGIEIACILAEMHRNPAIWGPDANLFRPERFTLDSSNDSLTESSFMPFGDGIHKCVGNQLAMIELKTFLFDLLRNFNFKPVPGFKCYENAFITMTPDPPLKLRIARRNK